MSPRDTYPVVVKCMGHEIGLTDVEAKKLKVQNGQVVRQGFDVSLMKLRVADAKELIKRVTKAKKAREKSRPVEKLNAMSGFTRRT